MHSAGVAFRALGIRKSAAIGVAKDLTKARNPFFVVMAAAVVVTVFVGFAPTFYLRSTFNPDKGLSILLHVHGFALSAWIVLFLVQTIPIARGTPTLHRRLGWVMVGIAASIVVFATLVGGAIYLRKRPDWHKRLMLSATILLVEAAVVRIVAFHGIHEPRYLMLSQYSSALLFFIPCFAYDWVTRRRIHPANIVGLTLIMMDQIVQPIVLSWPAWTNFANVLQRFVA